MRAFAAVLLSVACLVGHAQERVIQKASQADVTGGTNDTRFITPLKLATLLGSTPTNTSGFIPKLNGSGTNTILVNGVITDGAGFATVGSGVVIIGHTNFTGGTLQSDFGNLKLSGAGPNNVVILNGQLVGNGGGLSNAVDIIAGSNITVSTNADKRSFTISSSASGGTTNVVNDGASVVVTSQTGHTGLYLDHTNTTILSRPNSDQNFRHPSVEMDSGGWQATEETGFVFLEGTTNYTAIRSSTKLLASSPQVDLPVDWGNPWSNSDYLVIDGTGRILRRTVLGAELGMTNIGSASKPLESTLHSTQAWAGPTNTLNLGNGYLYYVAAGDCAITNTGGQIAGQNTFATLVVSNSTAGDITVRTYAPGVRLQGAATTAALVIGGGKEGYHSFHSRDVLSTNFVTTTQQ